MSGPTLHSVTGPSGSALARWLDAGPQLCGSFSTVARSLGCIVAASSARGATAPDLPAGPATAEAAGARAVDGGHLPAWGSPVALSSPADLLAFVERWGRESAHVVRSDPALLGGMTIGGWFDAAWRARLLRRVLLRAGRPAMRGAFRTRRPLLWRSAVDAAFWAGVRAEATPTEWARWTASSFVALCYHRLAGDRKPGQETIDLPPGLFARQLRMLRLLGFRPLSIDEVVEFLEQPDRTLPRRSYLLTCDDGFADALGPLLRAVAHRPVLFVPTGHAGQPAPFASGEPLASLEEIAGAARAGVAVGSHARTHRVLTDLSDADLDDELRRSRDELLAVVPAPVDVLAYPHGRHDLRVRAAARAAGWRAAISTTPGRNGAGTDRWCLHRLNVHAADGRLALLWKATSGELIPPAWERLRRRRASWRATRRPLLRDGPGGAAQAPETPSPTAP